MTITVGGTSITFNDGTTQTTAAGAPTTAQVLSATAGASVGAVGTYAFLYQVSNGTYSEGSTLSGGNLRYSGITVQTGNPYANSVTGGAPAGTWRCMGRSYTNNDPYVGVVRYGHTVWLRIS